MKKTELEVLKERLKTPRKIVITSHFNPDGDAVGSSLGLMFFLKKLGHDVQVVLPNEYPEFLTWLPGADKVSFYKSQKVLTHSILEQAEVIFCLDFNATDRVEEMAEDLRRTKAFKVLIDHHRQPEDFAQAVLWDVDASSTCELIYRFIQYFEGEKYIDKEIAGCLYTGIMTDTGSFKFASTSPETHRIAARLMETGIEASEIHTHVFDTNSFSRMQLLGRTLENLKLLPDYSTAYSTLSKNELEHFNFKKGDTEGFVNYGLSLKGIKCAAIFIENLYEPYIKISFRSIGDFDVNTFARKYFNGGGHLNAAGGKSFKTLAETTADFERAIKEYVQK